MWSQYMWTFQLMAALIGINAADQSSLCRRMNPVFFTKSVPKLVTVTYSRRNWFSWKTAYQTETRYVTENDYRLVEQLYCCPGYKGPTSNCQPICNSCGKNSFCRSPDTCACTAGYTQIDSGEDCLPQCNRPCGDHSFCSAPDRCECEVGYDENILDDGFIACTPRCKSGCFANSICIKPDECKCNEGYESSEDGHCQPVCSQGCPEHSNCIKPGECQCDKDYESSHEGTSCQPICSQGCPEHSSCQGPEQCMCNIGYSERENKLCEPQCTQGCSDFARCVAPDVCECFPGYEKSKLDNKCQPKCSQGCLHGYCFTPEICACSSGYLMGPNNSCEPQCSQNCIHGNCAEPEMCQCWPGYHFAPNSQHMCEPICEPKCHNGDCVAPQTCICNIGYEPDGAAMSNVCKPSCLVNCVNATCQLPDQCSCFEGYVPLNPSINTICKPNCSLGCENGVCTEPETCQCDVGYERTNDGCQLPITTETTETTSWDTTETTHWDTTETTHWETTHTSFTSDAPLDFLQQPLTNCISTCRCWSELTEPEAAVKCINICMDAFDSPCLDIAQCRCEQLTGHLHCNASSDVASEATRYVCKVAAPSSFNKTDKATGEAALNTPKSASSAAKWPAILAWCTGICILFVSLTTVIHFYLKHRRLEAIAQRVDGISIASLDRDL